LAPFFRYCSTILQSGSEKMTTRCHSVFSLRSPVPLSRQVADQNHLVYASRHRRSPLDIAGKNYWSGRFHARPPSILDLSLIHLPRPFPDIWRDPIRSQRPPT
jgi:hypothetical protein